MSRENRRHGDTETVNHPAHYTAGKIEVIDFIEDQELDFHLGNVVKYVARSGRKRDELEDLKKAAWYLARKIVRLENRKLALPLCLCAVMWLGALAAAQNPTPTNLGPVRTTTQDDIGTAVAPQLPPANICRRYYNTVTGQETWVNSSGGNCAPTGSGSCTNCIVTSGGNAQIAGNFEANSFETSGLFPWSVVGGFGTLAAPPAGNSMLGFGAGGFPAFSANGAAVLLLATQDGFGHVLQPALTAAALAASPAQCSGNYATGIQANGAANCATSTIVLIPQQTCSAIAGIAGYMLLCADSGGSVETNINNGGWGALVYQNLHLTSADVLEQYNGTDAQTFNLYGTYSAAGANYQRLGFNFNASGDGGNGTFDLASQVLGSPGTACGGGACGIGFKIGSSQAWAIDSSSRLVPEKTDNTQDIGHSGNRMRDLWVGRAVRTGTTSNTDLAGTISISASTTGTYTFANVGYASAPICTVSPNADPTAVGVWWKSASTTTLTVTVKTSGTITFDYICHPRT